ncbi:CHAT domain-containing protein [Geodermatophilus sp. URMC 62]|uniref:CHAT domain-containing protein n=1 Tax=Geodermatophilus sp. URMC 62 TaxID=3423414 RepID=UPI00406C0A9E
MEIFTTLFSDDAARYAYSTLRDRDPRLGIISRDPTVNAWRAWLEAKEALAQGRPWAAVSRIKRSTGIGGTPPGSLVSLEQTAVLAECAAQGYQPVVALDLHEQLRSDLFRFAGGAAADAHPAADQLMTCLREIVGAEGMRIPARDLVGSWAIGRGLPLLLRLSARAVELLVDSRHSEDAAAAGRRCETDIDRYHDLFGLAFGPEDLEAVEMCLGNVWTALDPEVAAAHFTAAGGEDVRKPSAAANLANCLLRLGRFREARARYARLESYFELIGDHLGASRVWAGECIAAWKERPDPTVRHSLAGAISMFEDHIPDSADRRTLYTIKRFLEPALSLMITVLAASEDRSDERINDFLSVLWALQRPEQTAGLDRELPEGRGWDRLLAARSRPLEITRSMLEPFATSRVVHLCSATDEVVLVVYGFLDGAFSFEAVPLGEAGAADIERFLTLMDEQLAADLRRDSRQLRQIDAELAGIGEHLGKRLTVGARALLRSAEVLYYMPHPYGAVDRFPLGALRLDGRWLASTTSILRTPGPNHLRELLSATRPPLPGSRAARVVTGDPDAGPSSLKLLHAESARAAHILTVLGFDAAVETEAGADDVVDLLDGAAGIVHYVGHGLASEVYEGLPLTSGEVLRPYHLDRLPGFTTGFVFLCACDGASVRHGPGGYQTGMASRLAERGAPGLLAFNHAVPEERASQAVRCVYPRLRLLPFGEAVRGAQESMSHEMPAYTWLSLSAFGDPELQLASLTQSGAKSPSSAKARTWHAALRSYAVLRTDEALREAEAAVPDAPLPVRLIVRELLYSAYRAPGGLTAERLIRLDSDGLDQQDHVTADGLLSLHAVIVLQRAHACGLDTQAIGIPSSRAEILDLYSQLVDVTLIGSALFDTRLNGLAHALLGRLRVRALGEVRSAERSLEEALEKLLEAVPASPFLARIHQETGRILAR